MNLDFIKEMYIPVVLVACLVIGYCIKHISWLDKIANEYIPTILAVVGMVLSVVIAVTEGNPVNVSTFVYGAFTGLASTGLHQMFAQIINKDNND